MPTTVELQAQHEALGRNCSSIFTNIVEYYDKLRQIELETKKAETSLLKVQIEEKQSSDLFGSIYGQFKTDVSAGIETFLGEDFISFSDLSQGLDGALSNILDYKNPLGALALTSTSMLGTAGASLGLFSSSGAAELTANMQSLKGKCDLTGEAPKAIDMLAQNVSNISDTIKSKFSEIAKLSSAFDNLRGNYEGFGAGLLTVVGNTLKIGLRREVTLIKEIKHSITQINGAVKKMSNDDYVTNHAYIISTVRDLILDANVNLDDVLTNISLGGNIPEGNLVFAKENITLAKDTLGNTKLELKALIPSLNAIKVAMYLVKLENQLIALEQLQLENQNTVRFFGAFEDTFIAATPGVDYVYAPIIDLIKCRLIKTANDMKATLDKKAQLTFLLKEKQWYVELLIALAFFKAIKTGEKGADFLRNLHFAVDYRPQNVVSSYDGTTSNERVQQILALYLRQVRKKIKQNVTADSVVNLGVMASFELDQYVKQRPNFSGALLQEVFGIDLPPALASVVSDQISGPIDHALSALSKYQEGIAMAQTYIGTMNNLGFDLSVEALMKGDFDNFFAFANFKETVRRLIDLAAGCLDTTEPDPKRMNQMLQLNYKLSGQVRSADIFADVYYRADQNYLEVVLGQELPALQNDIPSL